MPVTLAALILPTACAHFTVVCDRHGTPCSVSMSDRAQARQIAEEFRLTHLDFSPTCRVEVVEVTG